MERRGTGPDRSSGYSTEATRDGLPLLDGPATGLSTMDSGATRLGRVHVIFSRKSDYGLRALMYLAERQGHGPVTLQEVSEQLMIPRAFLSKILQQLARKGVVRSLKGPTGGFVLAVEPAEITLFEVLTEIDGPARVFECFATDADCTLYGDCLIRDVFGEVDEQISKVLARYTLADFAHRKAAHAAKV
jgi:Rrf2 family protein